MGRASRAITFLTAALLLALAACSSVPVVRAERDASAVFSDYATFGFFEPAGTDKAGYESLVTQALKAATRREMEARGYRYTESGADLLVNFNAQLADRTDVQPRAMPVPHPEYYGYRNYVTWPDYGVVVDKYQEGTLNIDVVDAQRKRMIWEGVAIGRVTEKVQRHRVEAIDKAVAEIFKAYPVPARP